LREGKRKDYTGNGVKPQERQVPQEWRKAGASATAPKLEQEIRPQPNEQESPYGKGREQSDKVTQA